MPWFKVDDGLHSHPKWDDVSLAAAGLWMMAGSYASHYLTDGEISHRRVLRLGGTPELAAELVDAGLWIETDDGYQFHDWHDYQPTRAEVEEQRDRQREQTRQRVRKHRESKRTSNAGVTRVTADPCNAPVTHAPTRPDPTNTRTIDQPATPVDPFTQFWDTYPRKVGKRKAQAAYKTALKRASPEAIQAGAERYRDDPNREDAYTAHPTTWLNRDGWDDPPLPTGTSPPEAKPTRIPPRFDPAALRPDNAIPMPDNIRQLLTGETA